MALWEWVLVFVGSGAALVPAGTGLSRAADDLSARAGWSRLYVGMLLVAVATSLPELFTGVSAASAGAPRLAVGDLLGSCMANMAILAVVDLVAGKRLFPNVELGQARLASIAVGLTSLVALAMLTPTGPVLGWVGLDTMAVAASYAAAVAWVRRSPVAPRAAPPPAPAPVSAPGAPGGGRPDAGPRRAGWARGPWARFAVSAAVLAVTAPLLAVASKEIAGGTGVGETFVGTSLLAVVTSLPELVTALAALKLGAEDMAAANLFGSNAVAMALLVIVDLADTGGPLLGHAGRPEVVAAVGAVLLMAVALSAIVHGARTRIARLEPDAVFLLCVYAGCLYAVWVVRP